jgi:hypothetical protein
MICTNCFEADMIESTTGLDGIGTVPCEKCPKCEYILFNQEQSDIIDKIRRGIE